MMSGTKPFLGLKDLCNQLTDDHFRKQFLQVLLLLHFPPMLSYRFHVKGSRPAVSPTSSQLTFERKMLVFSQAIDCVFIAILQIQHFQCLLMEVFITEMSFAWGNNTPSAVHTSSKNKALLFSWNTCGQGLLSQVRSALDVSLFPERSVILSCSFSRLRVIMRKAAHGMDVASFVKGISCQCQGGCS